PRAFDRGVGSERRRRRWLLLNERVDADDDALPGLDLALPAIRGLVNLLLHPARLDRGQHAAHLIDSRDQLRCPAFPLRREMLDPIAAAERIRGVAHAALVRQHLLRA